MSSQLFIFHINSICCPYLCFMLNSCYVAEHIPFCTYALSEALPYYRMISFSETLFITLPVSPPPYQILLRKAGYAGFPLCFTFHCRQVPVFCAAPLHIPMRIPACTYLQPDVLPGDRIFQFSMALLIPADDISFIACLRHVYRSYTCRFFQRGLCFTVFGCFSA